jgi:hypothetical protein
MPRPTFTLLTIVCLIGTLVHTSSVPAQTPASNGVKPIQASRIHQLYVEDQSENPHNITEQEHNRHGIARRSEIRAMLTKGEIEAASDFHDAAVLFQHGETADDFMMAHVFAIEAVLKGDNSSKWIAAATLDRYLQIIGRPQIFGTQYDADTASGASKEHGKQVDAKVANLRRTQSPFDEKLLPDSVRNDFCVPDLMQQKKNLEILNTGHYPEHIVPPGCDR